MKHIKKVLSVVCAALMAMPMALGLVSCKKGSDGEFDDQGNYKPSRDTTELQFWGWGDDTESTVFQTITDNFNQTVGKENNISVRYTQKAANSYSSNTALSLAGNNPPDIVYVEDKYVKSWADAGYLVQLDTKTNGEYDLKGYDFENSEKKLWDSGLSRYRFNPQTTTSNANDPLWALPKDIGPTVLYYNTVYLKKRNITEISVPESELAAYNKAHGTNYTAKGYDAEKKVFNNRIAMNWSETIALAREMQEIDGCDFGYYNEWWYAYGWSVGGDVVEYVSDNGGSYYKFTLNDKTPNYIVKDDETSITVNGTTYQAGEIVSYTDKTAMSASDKGKCNELPSMYDAFLEFVALTSKEGTEVGTKTDGSIQKGYGVSMGAQSLGTADAEDYFASGKFGMFVDIRSEVSMLREKMSNSTQWGAGSWNVAPLPVYKEYNADGSVKAHGIAAGHSSSMGLAISEGSQKKNAAWVFLKYMAGEEGQTTQAKAGFALPNQIALANDEDVFLQTKQDPSNSIVFVEAAAYQRPGDWWTLTDSTWIDDWASYLNYTVRENKATVDEMFNKYYDKTQTKLYAYTGYKG
jgi:multiple sugar transport system substrate-binding protein